MTLKRMPHKGVVTHTDLNEMIAQLPRSRAYGINSDGIVTTATSYPVTPDRRLRVDSMMPVWCYVQAWAKTTAGTGSVRFELETSVGGKVDIAEMTFTSSTGQGLTGKANMETLGGVNHVGNQCWINVYVKTTSGTATVMGFTAYSSFNSVDSESWSPT